MIKFVSTWVEYIHVYIARMHVFFMWLHVNYQCPVSHVLSDLHNQGLHYSVLLVSTSISLEKVILTMRLFAICRLI